MVGQCTVRSLEEFRCLPEAERETEEERGEWRRTCDAICSRKTKALLEHVQYIYILCVCSCLGETPHLISEDVFIDIDDEEPLVPNQVKPT